jgi:hypothetical protein
MHHCAIEDPSNVVILNVNGLELQEVSVTDVASCRALPRGFKVKEEDFLLFDNVLHIDASENQLPFRE